jgi:hypothetical protein
LGEVTPKYPERLSKREPLVRLAILLLMMGSQIGFLSIRVEVIRAMIKGEVK